MRKVDELTVFGDMFLSDTRTVVACLDIGEVEHAFKNVKPNPHDEALGLNQGEDYYKSLANAVPVIELNGKKIMGSGYQIILNAALLDKRNATKFNAKGKPIK